MYLQIATTHQPATDLGFLLRKNPENVHRSSQWFGQTVLFYPQADETRCEAVLLLDVDPVSLVRGREGARGAGLLDHYVNDRPYAVSSFLSVAMARTLRDAMAGRAPVRPDLADTAIPLEFTVTPLLCRGAEDLVEALFAPLGYALSLTGEGLYKTLTLTGTLRLADALNHLYVLIPVLDNRKHYWVGSDEVEKLVAKGGAWLQAHPARELIARRYLTHRRFVERALTELDEAAGIPEDQDEGDENAAEDQLEKPLRLNDQRYEAVTAALLTLGARKVCDLGCGEGRLLARLMQERQFNRIVGFEVSSQALERAERRLKLDRMPPTQRARMDVYRGSLVYEDDRLSGFDAIVLAEVIEHVDAERLDAVARVVFGRAAPDAVVITTPNIEYNATFENLSPGKLRHADHRFEWTRAEFETWARGVGDRFGYGVAFSGIGERHETHGCPTQMAVFERGAA
ncbi:MAG: 3' terminal RNA ribose 2'-O-methyltransferase Hen1 [Magnetospiraceae bacterium]